MKVVFIVGQFLAGKTTFASMLEDSLSRNFCQSVARVEFSDSITRILKAFELPLVRENYSQLCEILKAEFGGGLLTCAVRKKLSQLHTSSTQVALVSGARLVSDLDVLAHSDSPTVIALTAREDIRFERAAAQGKSRYRTLEDMRQAEAAETEGEIDKLIYRSNMCLANNGSMADLGREAFRIAKHIAS